MRILKQSPSLKTVFQNQVKDKVSSKQQGIEEELGGGFMGTLGAGLFQFQQIKNQIKGNLGENATSLPLMVLPDTWIMCQNALIPTSSGKLTEIDILLIGSGGVFLVEVKTWKGSYAAYQDNWKRREGREWIPLNNSPTSQSAYHQKMFKQWMTSQVFGLPENFVSAPIVFPFTQWIGVTDCSTPVLQGLNNLIKMIAESPHRLTPEQVLKIGEVIEDYHIPTVSSSTKPRPVLRKNLDKY